MLSCNISCCAQLAYEPCRADSAFWCTVLRGTTPLSHNFVQLLALEQHGKEVYLAFWLCLCLLQRSSYLSWPLLVTAANSGSAHSTLSTTMSDCICTMPCCLLRPLGAFDLQAEHTDRELSTLTLKYTSTGKSFHQNSQFVKLSNFHLF